VISHDLVTSSSAELTASQRPRPHNGHTLTDLNFHLSHIQWVTTKAMVAYFCSKHSGRLLFHGTLVLYSSSKQKCHYVLVQ